METLLSLESVRSVAAQSPLSGSQRYNGRSHRNTAPPSSISETILYESPTDSSYGDCFTDRRVDLYRPEWDQSEPACSLSRCISTRFLDCQYGGRSTTHQRRNSWHCHQFCISSDGFALLNNFPSTDDTDAFLYDAAVQFNPSETLSL